MKYLEIPENFEIPECYEIPQYFQISNFVESVKSVKIVKNKWQRLHLAHLMYWYFLRKCEQYFDKNKTSVTQANEAMGQQLPLTAVNLQNLFHICQEISTVLHFRFLKATEAQNISP